MSALHQWEVLETYLHNGADHPRVRRMRVPGGWIYETRMILVHCRTDEEQDVVPVSNSTVFVPHVEWIP